MHLQCPEVDYPPYPKEPYTAFSRFLRLLLLSYHHSWMYVFIFFHLLFPQCTANRNFPPVPPLVFHISSISFLICSSHSHLRYGKYGKEVKAGEETIIVFLQSVRSRSHLTQIDQSFPYNNGWAWEANQADWMIFGRERTVGVVQTSSSSMRAGSISRLLAWSNDTPC